MKVPDPVRPFPARTKLLMTAGAARRSRWQRRVRGKVGSVAGADLVTSLRQAGVNRGDLVALVVSPALELGLAAGDSSWTIPGIAAEVSRADAELRPRWVLWSEIGRAHV